jgi:hypothetical protein
MFDCIQLIPMEILESAAYVVLGFVPTLALLENGV